jgi:hypothetical protein
MGLGGGIRRVALIARQNLINEAQNRRTSEQEVDEIFQGTQLAGDSVESLLWFYALAPLERAANVRVAAQLSCWQSQTASCPALLFARLTASVRSRPCPQATASGHMTSQLVDGS